MTDDAGDDKAWRDGFRARLRQIRGTRTREDMADLLGVSAAAYAKWEDRGSECPLRVLPKLWKIGQVTPEWLLEGRELQQKPKPPRHKSAAA